MRVLITPNSFKQGWFVAVARRFWSVLSTGRSLLADVRNKRHFRETGRNLEPIRALHEIDLAIASTMSLSSRLDVLLEKIEVFLPIAAATTVRLLNRRTGALESLACRGFDEDKWKAQEQTTPTGRAKTIVETKAPLTVPNVQTDLRTHNRELFRERGLVSYLGVPLITRDEVIGVLGLYTSEVHEFTDEEIEFLNSFAGQAAVAIDNARLYEQTERQLKRVEAMGEIDMAVTSSLDLQTVLKILLERVDRFVPHMATATVRLLNLQTGRLESLACRGFDEAQWKGPRAVIGRRSKTILETKAPLVVDDVRTDRRSSDQTPGLKSGLVSYAGFPLIAKDEVLGILTVHTKEKHEFTHEEMESLTRLASRAAIAIHNARLYEETERRRREAEELARVARSLTETLDIKAVGERIVTSVRDLFGVKGSTLRVIESDGSFRRLASAGQVFSQSLGGEILPPAMEVTARALAERRPICSADILNDPEISLTDQMRDYQLRSGNGAMIAAPLQAHEKLTGALSLFDQKGRTYSDSEVALLQTFADQAALALENARLYEETGRSKKELEKTNEYLERSLQQLGGLYTALTPITAAASNQEMMSGIIDRLIDATGADACLIRLLDRDTDQYRIVSQRGFSDYYLTKVAAISTGSAVDWVVTYGQPLIVPDIAVEPRLTGKIQLQLGLRSCAMLPLRVGDQVRGFMQVASRKLGYFQEEQRDHLLAIARQIGIALENRELFYDLKLSRDELERANKGKDEFLSVISHELRTPLNVIKGYTQIIADEILGEINPEQKLALRKIMHQSGELLSMINSVLQVTRIGANAVQVEWREVDLGDFLNELRSNYDFPLEKELRLDWDYPSDLPIVRTDDEKLKHILRNLINNAIKFSDKGTVSISVRHSSEAETVEFKVADTGIGIPKDKIPDIFDMFRQVDSSLTRSYGGVGVGLYIVKTFTELLEGKIEVQSEVGKGSTFTVILPDKYKIDSSTLRQTENLV